MKPEDIPQVVESLAPNVVGFKSYFISGMDTFPAVDEAQFAAAAQACAKGGRPLLLHAEDPDVIAEATRERAFIRGTQKHQWIDYYASRPMDAEMAAVLKALKLAGQYAKNIHIVHVGTAKAAIAVSERGATCETCAHYLAFDETDFARLGAALKTAPPVKAPEQKAMLWHLLADGQIGFVTSDHAGAPEYEKYTDDPLTAYGGIPGTGTLFPYLLSEGLFAKRLPLERFLEATSGGAARRYGLWQAKGSLLPGKDADFVLVDPDHTSRVIPSNMMSKSAITPFAGMLLSGRIEGTFVRGSCVYASVRLAAALGKKSDTIVNEAGMILARPGFGKISYLGVSMSKVMKTTSLSVLLERITGEYLAKGTIFEIPKATWLDVFEQESESTGLGIMSANVSIPLGPAAGPPHPDRPHLVAAFLSAPAYSS